MSLSQPTSSAVGMSDKLHRLRNNEETWHSTSALVESESALPSYSETEEQIGNVLKTVDVLNEEINRIEDLLVKIAKNHTAILSSHQNETAKVQNEKYHEEVKTLTHHIGDELKRMKRDLDEESLGSERHTADCRIKRAHYNTIARRFRETMLKLNEEEEDYREKNKAVLQRQLKITGQFQTEDKVEELLEQENPQIFVENILGRGDQRMLNEVQSRHQEVLRLESNIRDLYDMFYDLSQLVFDQGEQINQIEFNVDKAAGYVDKARQQVRVATDYRRKNNSLKVVICCVVTTVTIVLVVVIVIVVAAVGYFAFGRD